MSQAEWIEIAQWSDYLVTQRMERRAQAALFMALKNNIKFTWVLDFDDNFGKVDPSNTEVYENFRPKTLDEEFIFQPIPADKVKEFSEAAAKVGDYVVDRGGAHFYVKEKIQDPIHYAEIMMGSADVVTTSTKELRDVYWPINQNMHVWPNSYDFNYAKPVRHTDKKAVNIFWQGSKTHYDDMMVVYGALRQVMAKYPDVTFTHMGMSTDFLEDLSTSFPGRVKHVNYVLIDEWHKTFNSLAMDIGICPLEGTPFNRCKSNLKWLEFAARKVPVVASDINPYRCIEDGKTGYLAKTHKEWVECLSKLILQHDLRQKMGEAAHLDAMSRYNLATNAALLMGIFKSKSQKVLVK